MYSAHYQVFYCLIVPLLHAQLHGSFANGPFMDRGFWVLYADQSHLCNAIERHKMDWSGRGEDANLLLSR